MRLLPCSAALVLLFALPALAEAPTVTGGLGLSLTTEGDAGARQSAGTHVEADFGGIHGGLSYDAYKDSNLNELDLYLGYRTTLGALDLDTSYTRYTYPNDGGDCCGGVNLNLGLPVGPVTAGLDMNYYPDDKSSDYGLSLDYALPMSESVTLSTSFTVNNGAGDASTEWEVAAAYQLGAASSITARVDDGSDYDPYVGLDLSWDFTLMGQ